MTRFLIATMAVPGHITPFAPIARELTQRGHEVAWYSSQFFKDKIEASGARFFPIKSAIDYGDNDYNRYWPERATLKGLDQVKFDFINLFVGSIEGQYEDLLEILKDFKADVLLHDSAVVAAMWLGLAGRLPTAMLNISVAHFPSRDLAPFGLGVLPDSSTPGHFRNRIMNFMGNNVIMRPVNQAYIDVAKRHHMPVFPFRPTPSPFLTLQPSVPEIEYRISDLPPTLHYIGALLPLTPEFTPPVWWAEITQSSKAIVLVTQGTIATNSEQLIQPTLQALETENVRVIATTGGKTAAELGLQVPANARVEPFIPFVPLMKHVAVYITNGGFGGVMIALANGVPVIGGGNTEDKAEVNNRLTYAGIGINLKTPTPTPDQLHQAVQTILKTPGYKQNAQKVQAALARHDAPHEAADLLEKLAATRQPILNA